MTTLYRYQRKGVYAMRRFRGRVLVADEMGLGKSLQALSFMARWKSYPTIIVCPASLKWNWEREIATHLNLSCEILEGRKPPRVNRSRVQTPNIVIINYDILKNWVPWLLSLKPKLVIFDEAHYCGNVRTQRTKAMRALTKGVEQIIGLTGTPLINRPAELWPILNLIRGDLYPHFRPFADAYCAPKLTPWGWQFKGATNLLQLHAELREHLMVRRMKAKVLKDLPKNRQIIVPLHLKDRKQYDLAQTDFLHWVARQKGISTAKRVRGAEAMAKWTYLTQLAAELKLDQVYEWIDNFLQSSDEKLVVFGIHHAILKPLHHRYLHTSVLINGSVPGKERQRRVDQIQTNPKVRLLFGNIDAAGVGLNITIPNTVLFVEIPFTPADISQAIARVNRIGQTQDTTSYFLVAQDTIEEKLLRLVRRKQQITESAIDGLDKGSMEDIYGALLKELNP